MVREVLGSAGFLVEEADGGRRGVQLFESFRPDVVLLDIVMPDMDGFATLSSLRRQNRGSDCPVVMITGLLDPGAVGLAYELGATDFVTKPINWSLLRHRVNYALRTSTKDRAPDWEMLKNAVRLAGVGTWRWDPETDRLNVSSLFLSLLGLRRSAPLASRFALARIHRKDRTRILRDLLQSISGNGEGGLETSFRVATRGHGNRVVRVRANAVQGEAGSVGLTGILEDITDQERMERKLRELLDLCAVDSAQ